jgi:hypothetical protein
MDLPPSFDILHNADGLKPLLLQYTRNCLNLVPVLLIGVIFDGKIKLHRLLEDFANCADHFFQIRLFDHQRRQQAQDIQPGGQRPDAALHQLL